MANTMCTIPSIVFHLSPFSLPWASSIYAQIIATNIYGNSYISEPGNGATIYAIPDRPINLAEDYS
jgi:hypothetical protein